MNTVLRSALAAAGLAFATQAVAEITFYEHDGFQGRSFSTAKQVGNFEKFGFNDRASSVIVLHERWEVCQDARFGGQCVVLRPGRYPSLSAMGLNDRVSSVRIVASNVRVDEQRYAPAPMPVYDNRRRNNERVYEADVTSVRAVVGQQEQRCWIEKEQVSQDRSGANVPGAVVGGIIGGVLGHQWAVDVATTSPRLEARSRVPQWAPTWAATTVATTWPRAMSSAALPRPASRLPTTGT
jgi:hypothetical protein